MCSYFLLHGSFFSYFYYLKFHYGWCVNRWYVSLWMTCSLLIILGLVETRMLWHWIFLRNMNFKWYLVLLSWLAVTEVCSSFSKMPSSQWSCAWLCCCCCCSLRGDDYPACCVFSNHILREELVVIVIEVLVAWDLSRSSRPTSFSKHVHQISLALVSFTLEKSS